MIGARADGRSDFLYQNLTTGATLIYYVTDAIHLGFASIGPVKADLIIGGTGDFNGDGKPDIVFQNAATKESLIWLMNGATRTGTTSLGTMPAEWQIIN